MQYDDIEQALARFNNRENANEVAEGAFLGAAAAGIMVARENQKATLSAIESASENAARTIGDAVVSASSAAIREIVSSIGTVVQSAFEVESDAKASPLLQRAFIFLEDGEHDRALEYLDRVLDLKPTCSRAYLGMFMLGKGIARIEEIPRIESSDYRRSILPDFPDFEKAIRFALEEERSLLVELQQSQLKVTRLRFCEDADEGIKIGNQYLSEGKFSDAEEFFANLQMLHPDEPRACLGLLLCKYEVKIPMGLVEKVKGTTIDKAAIEGEPLYIKLMGLCDEKLRAQLQSVRDRQIQIKQGQEYSRIKQLFEAASGLDDYRKAMDAASPLAAIGHEGAEGIVSKCEKAINQIKANQELLAYANKEAEIGSRRGLTRALEILSKALPWAPAVDRAEAIKARLAEMTAAQEERRIEAQGLFAEFCKMQSELDGDIYDGGCSSVLTCLLCDDAIILAVDKDMPAGLFESIKEMDLTVASQALMDDLDGFSGDTLSRIGAESLSEIAVPRISNKDALDCLSSCHLVLIDRAFLLKKTTLVRNKLMSEKKRRDRKAV